MSNAPKKSIPRPGRKPSPEPAEVSSPAPTPAQPANDSKQIAILAAQAGLEKKATGVEIIDVMGKVDYADYLVLMTGASDRNVAAIAQEVDGALSKAGFRSMSVEGLPAAQWVLIDFVDVVVHVFQKDVRSLYDLDGLWMDAERLPVASSVPSDPVDSERIQSDVVFPARSRSKASKRPTKKAKTAGSKPAARRAVGAAAGARVAAGGRSTAAARSSTGDAGRARKATGARATAGGRAGTSGASATRSSTRSAAAAKPARKSKASKGKK